MLLWLSPSPLHLLTFLVWLSIWHIGQVDAFFRLFLDVLAIERVDPLVASGDEPSGHVHIIAGSTGFDGKARFKELMEGDCTSTPTGNDMSAYWTPMLYYRHKTKGFKSLPVADLTVYYKYEMDGSVKPFGKDFQMRAGDSKARTADPIGAVKWKCINSATDITNTPHLPTTPCKDGLRAELSFPNCWNGKIPKDLSDTSHIKYAPNFRPMEDNGVTTDCTDPSHPIRVPRLFFEVMFKNDDPEMRWEDAMNPSQPYVLSNGDSTGHGFHGDFLNGWNPHFLARVLESCDGKALDGTNDASGEPQTCFADVRTTPNTCKKMGDSPDLASHEKVVGVWLEKLPGNNPVT